MAVIVKTVFFTTAKNKVVIVSVPLSEVTEERLALINYGSKTYVNKVLENARNGLILQKNGTFEEVLDEG